MSTLMTTKPAPFLPNHPFWSFSCQIYTQVKQPLLALQERHNINVNVILFCAWVAASNQGLFSKTDMKKLLTHIHTWHERIVVPLRNIRLRIKETDTNNFIESIRTDISDTELMSEQVEQLLMADTIIKKGHRARKTHMQRAVNACQNIDTYCQVSFIRPDNIDCTYISEIMTAIFPEIGVPEAHDLCRSIFLSKKKSKGTAAIPVKKQLQLELLDE